MYLLTADVGELLDLTRQVWRDRLLGSAATRSRQRWSSSAAEQSRAQARKSVGDVMR